MSGILTDFRPDPERLSVMAECIEDYDVGSPDEDWPNNIISQKAVVYGSGVIARVGDVIEHRVDEAELALCKQLSAEVCAIMDGAEVGMGSESGAGFRPFFIAANEGEDIPGSITEEFIRKKFGGTLFPLVTISVESLEETGIWWSEVLHDVGGFEGEDYDEYMGPWQSMMNWFHEQPGLSHPVFIRIGNPTDLRAISRSDYPEGTEITGCVMPRMAVALSAKGSLIGLFGHVVKT